MDDLAALDPQAPDRLGPVAGGGVGLAALKFGDDQARAQHPQHRREITAGGAAGQAQVVEAIGIAGRRHAQLAARKARQEQPLDHAAAQDVPGRTRHPFAVEAAARQSQRLERVLDQVEMPGGNGLAQRLAQEGHAPKLRHAGQGSRQIGHQRDADSRVEQHRAPATGNRPRAQSRPGAFGGRAHQLFGRGQRLDAPFLRLAEGGRAPPVVLRQHHRPAPVIRAADTAAKAIARRQRPQPFGGHGDRLPDTQGRVGAGDVTGHPVHPRRRFEQDVGIARAIGIQLRRGTSEGEHGGGRQARIRVRLDMGGGHHRLLDHPLDRGPVEARRRRRAAPSFVKDGQPQPLRAAALGGFDVAATHRNPRPALMLGRGTRRGAPLDRQFDRQRRRVTQSRFVMGQERAHASVTAMIAVVARPWSSRRRWV